MTDNKTNKTIVPKNKEPENGLPARKSFQQRSLGALSLDESVLDLKNKAYRWGLTKDKYGRDDYGQCFDMGYRDVLQTSLKGRIKSDVEDKIIRELKDGIYILMEAPIEYRQMTNDEIAQTTEAQIRHQMKLDDNSQIDGRNITINN